MTSNDQSTAQVTPARAPKTTVALPWFAAGCMISMLAGMIIQSRMIPSAPEPKIAVLGKNEVILKTMLDHQDLANSPEKVQHYLVEPINKYQLDLANKGFVVLEATKDEHGGYAVNAMPKNVVDQTDGLMAAVSSSMDALKKESGGQK